MIPSAHRPMNTHSRLRPWMAARSPPIVPRIRIGASAVAIQTRYCWGGATCVAPPVWVQIVNVASESTRPCGKFVKNDEKNRT